MRPRELCDDPDSPAHHFVSDTYSLTELAATQDDVLYLGNGGAGPTGLLKALSEDFLSVSCPTGAVHWVCNHSRNTQVCLLDASVDVALTYERDMEELAALNGLSSPSTVVFHDHFVIAGPISNPARIEQSDDLFACFRKIHEAGQRGTAIFHSRADGSATMVKERSIWKQTGHEPWPTSPAWYRMSHLSPSEALVKADQEGAYLLSDRSTLLAQTAKGSISNTTVFCEPNDSMHPLMNSCAVSTRTVPSPLASLFVQYLLSDRAQRLIEDFGRQKAGLAFFARRSDGFARSFLVGGQPRNSRWIGVNS